MLSAFPFLWQLQNKAEWLPPVPGLPWYLQTFYYCPLWFSRVPIIELILLFRKLITCLFLLFRVGTRSYSNPESNPRSWTRVLSEYFKDGERHMIWLCLLGNRDVRGFNPWWWVQGSQWPEAGVGVFKSQRSLQERQGPWFGIRVRMDCCRGHLAAESPGEGADMGNKSTIGHSLDTDCVAFSVLGTSVYNTQPLQQLFQTGNQTQGALP